MFNADDCLASVSRLRAYAFVLAMVILLGYVSQGYVIASQVAAADAKASGAPNGGGFVFVLVLGAHLLTGGAIAGFAYFLADVVCQAAAGVAAMSTTSAKPTVADEPPALPVKRPAPLRPSGNQG